MTFTASWRFLRQWPISTWPIPSGNFRWKSLKEKKSTERFEEGGRRQEQAAGAGGSKQAADHELKGQRHCCLPPSAFRLPASCSCRLRPVFLEPKSTLPRVTQQIYS